MAPSLAAIPQTSSQQSFSSSSHTEARNRSHRNPSRNRITEKQDSKRDSLANNKSADADPDQPGNPSWLILPDYKTSREIQYPEFVRRLNVLNESAKPTDKPVVQRALLQVFVNLFGEEKFKNMRLEGKQQHPAVADWQRLQKQSKKYWKYY